MTAEPLLALFQKYKDSKGKQAKLKTPPQLQELLDLTKEQLLVREGGEGRGGAGRGEERDVLQGNETAQPYYICALLPMCPEGRVCPAYVYPAYLQSPPV